MISPKSKLDTKTFLAGFIPDLLIENKIKINYSYQRGSIWKLNQKIELIRSIFNDYSIGILVSFVNEEGQDEILDGQQRLIAINQYIKNELDLSKTDIPHIVNLLKRKKHY